MSASARRDANDEFPLAGSQFGFDLSPESLALGDYAVPWCDVEAVRIVRDAGVPETFWISLAAAVGMGYAGLGSPVVFTLALAQFVICLAWAYRGRRVFHLDVRAPERWMRLATTRDEECVEAAAQWLKARRETAAAVG